MEALIFREEARRNKPIYFEVGKEKDETLCTYFKTALICDVINKRSSNTAAKEQGKNKKKLSNLENVYKKNARPYEKGTTYINMNKVIGYQYRLYLSVCLSMPRENSYMLYALLADAVITKLTIKLEGGIGEGVIVNVII